MRTFRHAACIAVAVGAIALSVLQPDAASDFAAAPGATHGDRKRVDERSVERPADRAAPGARLVKT